MAEVRLCFGRRAYKFIKHSYLPLLDKNGKPVLNAAYVTAVIHSTQFCKNQNDRVAVDHACRVCVQPPIGTSSEPSARIFTRFRGADGYAGSLKATLDLLTENVSGNKWTDCIVFGTKDVITTVHRSSCLETHAKRAFLCSQHHFKHQLRRSICTKTLPSARLGQFSCEVLFYRAYSKRQTNGNPEEPLYKSKSAYYDILEVSPTATHAQIKTAYYKQSFIYHPDKNAGSEEATFRFSEISEAYHVLGNKALRRKYDRGILSQADLQGSSRSAGKESTASSPGQQTRARHSPSVGADRQNIFDFDTFIRSHYGEQLQREKEMRRLREKILRKQKQHYEDVKLGRMKEVAVGMLLAMAIAIVLSLRSSK